MRRSALLLAAMLSTPAWTAPVPRVGLHSVLPDGAGNLVVELVSAGSDASADALAPILSATLLIDGAEIPASLERLPDDSPRTISQGVRYRLHLPAGGRDRVALLSVPSLGISGAAVDLPQGGGERLASAAAPSEAARPPATPANVSPGRRNTFLDHFSPYRAVYAVYGPGTDTSTRIQLSFQYQLFGQPARDGVAGSWLDGITFAFTQRMFWDVEAKSAPIRDVDYMPELFYLVRPRPVSGALSLGGRAGVAHESNGRGGDASRSVNMIYAQPEATLPIGAWHLTVGPRLWAYVGRRTGNEDIAHYRGHTGLYAEFGRDDGLLLTADTRLNSGSGKGAAEAELSYPLSRLLSPDINLYVFGQAFTGYGENLLDYDRRQTRLRLGIGIVR